MAATRTCTVKRHHRDLEAGVLLANQMVSRNLDIRKSDRRRIRSALPHLVLVLVNEQPASRGTMKHEIHVPACGSVLA